MVISRTMTHKQEEPQKVKGKPLKNINRKKKYSPAIKADEYFKPKFFC